jgi:tetratricopeptide (TPR) repeat protein
VDAALRIALNTVLVVCTMLTDDVSPNKRSRVDRHGGDAVLLWRAVGAVLARRDVDAALRSELVQFVSAYVFVQLVLATDVPTALVQLTRDRVGACDDQQLSGDSRYATLLVAAHVALATGAHEACVEMCTAALALRRRGAAGNALFVRGSARLAMRQWLGAMADFDGAVRASYRFAASTLMREVSRLAAGGADWRAVAQAIGRAAEQHSDGSAASRADLDAATAMLNLALVFRAADRTEATATMLKLLADACARERGGDSDGGSELALTCRSRIDAATAAPDGDLRLRSLCSVSSVGVQYLAAKAALLAGQFSNALNLYSQLANQCPLTSDATVAPASSALPSVDALQLHREWVYALVCSGDSKRALTLCNKLIKIVDDPVIGLHRADAMVVLGLSQAALAQLDEIEQRLADDGSGDAMRAQLRSVVRNNRALLHVRLGELPMALKLLRLLVSAEPSNVTAAFNYCLLARSMGAAYEIEACVAWLEARQLPVIDDSLKFADLAARRRAALERLDPSDRSCVEAQPAVERVYDGAVSGAVTTRAALALDVSVLKRWCTLIADPRLQKRLTEARSRH